MSAHLSFNNALTVDVVDRHRTSTLNNMLSLINKLEYKRVEAYNIIVNTDYNISTASIVNHYWCLTKSLAERLDRYTLEYANLRLMSVDDTNYKQMEERLTEYDRYIYFDLLMLI